MKTVHFHLLLAALTRASTCLLLRKHVYVNESLAWNDAQTYCRDFYEDLSTIDTAEEHERFLNDTKAHLNVWGWIGLSKRENETSFTQWSDGSSGEFQKFKQGEPNDPKNQHCVATNNDEWYSYFCIKASGFFCYKWIPELTVVQERMSWEEALQYCRDNHTDLVSLTTETDLRVVKKKTVDAQTSSVWSGLHFLDGSWHWVNRDPVGYLLSLPSCPAQPFCCGARTSGADQWENRDCEEKLNFVCY